MVLSLAGGVVACWLGFAPEAGVCSTFLVVKKTTIDGNFERENHDDPSDLGIFGCNI